MVVVVVIRSNFQYFYFTMTVPSCVVPNECICYWCIYSPVKLQSESHTLCVLCGYQTWLKLCLTLLGFPDVEFTTTMTVLMICLPSMPWAFLSMTNMLPDIVSRHERV